MGKVLAVDRKSFELKKLTTLWLSSVKATIYLEEKNSK